MPRSDENALNELPRVANNDPDQAPEKEEKQPVSSDEFWGKVKWLNERGLWGGDYHEENHPLISLTKGAHYYVLDNPKTRSIRCISCPVRHGGILEAHLLTRYALKDGVLYLDGKAINTTPEGFSPGE